MPNTAVFSGVVLVVIAAIGYFGGEKQSVTALIPAFFGLPIAILGLLAAREALRKHAMHAAAAVGLLGFLGGVANVVRVMLKDEPANQFATTMTVAMAAVCLIFVGLCVKSFVDARKARENEPPQ